jgi:hypothetical protein
MVVSGLCTGELQAIPEASTYRIAYPFVSFFDALRDMSVESSSSSSINPGGAGSRIAAISAAAIDSSADVRVRYGVASTPTVYHREGGGGEGRRRATAGSLPSFLSVAASTITRHASARRSRRLPIPGAVFVASDSHETAMFVEEEQARGRWLLTSPDPAPPILTVNASRRFITPHGSHLPAAEGACGSPALRKACALPW